MTELEQLRQALDEAQNDSIAVGVKVLRLREQADKLEEEHHERVTAAWEALQEAEAKVAKGEQ